MAQLYAARRFSAANPSKGFLILPFFDNLEEVHIVDNLTLSEVEQVRHSLPFMMFLVKIWGTEPNKNFGCFIGATPTL